jgi:hypothetical protein
MGMPPPCASTPPAGQDRRSRENAFARTGDPAVREFRDAVLLIKFGEVDLDALSA